MSVNLFVEDINEVPEDAREFYEEGVNQDGKTGFVHKEVAALVSTLNKQKETLKQNSEGYKSLEEKLSKFEQEKLAAIEEAKAKALEEAKSKGDVEAIEQRYKEQMEDAVNRAREESKNEAMKEFEQKQSELMADSELQSIITKLNPVDDEAAELLKLKLKASQKVEDGKIIYLNDDGKASSLDAQKFADELIKANKFARLRVGVPSTTGGGLPNGNNGGKAPSSANQKAEEAKKKGDLKGFLDASIKF